MLACVLLFSNFSPSVQVEVWLGIGHNLVGFVALLWILIQIMGPVPPLVHTLSSYPQQSPVHRVARLLHVGTYRNASNRKMLSTKVAEQPRK